MNKAIVMSLVVCLTGAPVITAVTSTSAMAEAAKSGVLSQAEAVAFANKLKPPMTLPEAVKAGYLSPAQVPGTYVITSAGAALVGVGPSTVAGLSALQITALVAGVVGLTFVIVDAASDDDGGGSAGPTPTPTPTPTTAPTPTPTGGGTTTSTATLPPTPTPVVTPTPAPTAGPGGGNTTSPSTST